MPLIRVEGFGLSPLDAAARFYAEVAPRLLGGVARPVGDGPDLARHDQTGALTLLFAPTDHTHRGWQEAAVASLARSLAPRRINAMVGDDPAAIAAMLGFLEGAEALTGQLFPLDSHGAGEVLG